MPTYKRFILAAVTLFITINLEAQITTSSISGRMTDMNKKPIIGATILAIHELSGTRYGTVTNIDGRYTLQGMRAGGPYKILVSYIGMKPSETKGIMLQLGETFRHNVKLAELSEQLNEVVITGKAGVDATKTGAAMNISSTEINRMPSISHSIADVTRLNPQVRVANTGAMYFAGVNNRYNSFQIDGAMNNDAYGLTANGSNGRTGRHTTGIYGNHRTDSSKYSSVRRPPVGLYGWSNQRHNQIGHE